MNPGLGAVLSLEGRTALVTGGSRGIGRAIALGLSAAGAFVVVNYHTNHAAAQETQELIASQGGACMVTRFDVVDSASVEDGVGTVLAERAQVDILVNNAGITRDRLIGRMKDHHWQEVLDTNLRGAFNVCRAVTRSMIRRRWGRIVNVASTAGEAGNAGQVNYAAAKSGLIGFTRALARELAPRNILVNAVSPGVIVGGLSEELSDEQMEAIHAHIPLRRPGAAEEVAYAVLFLCSRMGDYITGQVVRVNGGLYM